MIKLRKAEDRGYAKRDWLESWHSFSFADYQDPEHMQFRALRVINEDIINPSAGFPTHGHRDMEIVTYILKGALEHKDSTGSTGVIRKGEVQRMSAGTGIEHSEYNPSDSESAHLFQIWLLPGEKGLQPGHEQKKFEPVSGELQLVGSPDGRDGSVTIHQDVNLYMAHLEKGQELDFKVEDGRYVWLQLSHGDLEVNGEKLGKSDAAAISDENDLKFIANDNTELLLFDLA